MLERIFYLAVLVASAYLAGCASVPLASPDDDSARKQFFPPKAGQAGLYVFRDSVFGSALKKSVYVDGQVIGETAAMTYLYQEVPPGKRLLSSESEFSNYDLPFHFESGKNYYVRQSIRLGAIVGGAFLQVVSEEEGRKGVLQCKLAQTPNLKLVAFDNPGSTAASASTQSSPSGSIQEPALEYYGQAETEIVTKSYDKNLWAKALVDAEGDEMKRKARYIELRARQLYTASLDSSTDSKVKTQTPIPQQSRTRNSITGRYISIITTDNPWTFDQAKHRKLEVVFEENGKNIIGVNAAAKVKIIGTRNEDEITFYLLPSDIASGEISGKWKVNEDGTELKGSWTYNGRGGIWNLTRID